MLVIFLINFFDRWTITRTVYEERRVFVIHRMLHEGCDRGTGVLKWSKIFNTFRLNGTLGFREIKSLRDNKN